MGEVFCRDGKFLFIVFDLGRMIDCFKWLRIIIVFSLVVIVMIIILCYVIII